MRPLLLLRKKLRGYGNEAAAGYHNPRRGEGDLREAPFKATNGNEGEALQGASAKASRRGEHAFNVGRVPVKTWELRYKMLTEAWLKEIQELEKNAELARPQTKKYYQSIAKTLYKALREATELAMGVTYLEIKD